MERKVIETEVWESDPEKKGLLHFVKTRKVYDVFKELEENMEANGMMPDEYFLLSHRFDKDSVMPRDASVSIQTRWGGNEGVYIDVDIEAFEGGKIHFATGKTLGETEEDYDRMAAIAAFIYKSFAGFGRVASKDKKEEQTTYVVCIDESYIRDSRYFNSKNLSNDDFYKIGINEEGCWTDIGISGFVDVVSANSEEEACEIVADEHGYDKRTMFAVNVSKRG